MDVNPQGSQINFQDPCTPWINDLNSVSMEGQAHDLNLLQGQCDERTWDPLLLPNDLAFMTAAPLPSLLPPDFFCSLANM